MIQLLCVMFFTNQWRPQGGGSKGIDSILTIPPQKKKKIRTATVTNYLIYQQKFKLRKKKTFFFNLIRELIKKKKHFTIVAFDTYYILIGIFISIMTLISILAEWIQCMYMKVTVYTYVSNNPSKYFYYFTQWCSYKGEIISETKGENILI